MLPIVHGRSAAKSNPKGRQADEIEHRNKGNHRDGDVRGFGFEPGSRRGRNLILRVLICLYFGQLSCYQFTNLHIKVSNPISQSSSSEVWFRASSTLSPGREWNHREFGGKAARWVMQASWGRAVVGTSLCRYLLIHLQHYARKLLDIIAIYGMIQHTSSSNIVAYNPFINRTNNFGDGHKRKHVLWTIT